MFQDPQYISMIGMGARNVRGLTKGIHLKWQFGADVNSGITNVKFDLYRRLHSRISEGHWIAIPINPVKLLADLKSTHVSISEFCTVTSNIDVDYNNTDFGVYGYVLTAYGLSEGGKITIEYNLPIRGFRLKELHKGGTVSVLAYAKSGDTFYYVGEAEPSGSWHHQIEADLIIKIEIAFDGKICITQAQQAINLDESEDDWEHICKLGFPADWAEASSRIPSSLAANLEDGYEQLAEIISKVSGNYSDDPSSGLLPFPIYNAENNLQVPIPQFKLQPLNMLLLVSLNPIIARMVGLYYIDETALAGKRYDYLLIGSWSKDGGITEEKHKWISYDLSLRNPDALTPSEGLTVAAKKLLSKEPVNTQTGCALRWNLPDSGESLVSPGLPVMYHVYRKLGIRQEKLTKTKPVIVGHRNPEKPFYIDGPLEDGDYEYRITYLDLFGRESPKSDAVAISLVDLVAPPPPTKVKAALDNAIQEVLLSWVWDINRQEMAPDARKFKVYYQTKNLVSLESYISMVINSGGSYDLETELHTGNDYSMFVGGFVIQNGRKFKVTSISKSSGKIIITVMGIKVVSSVHIEGAITYTETEVSPSAYPTGSAPVRLFLKYSVDPLKARGRFLLQLDWSKNSNWVDTGITVNVEDSKEKYEKSSVSIPLEVSKSIPVAYAIIGVSTVDESGNEGAISVPAKVAGYWTAKPEAPDLPAVVEYATRADYYGKSYYTLKLGSVDSEYYYEIMRATDAAIAFAKNMKADEISDSDLLDFAGSIENAFVKVGRVEQGAAGEFTDSFPGNVRNRYLYRTIAVDKADNRSGLSENVVLVKLHDVTPPRAPVITKIVGGDRQIALHWAKSREKDLTGYKIFRAESEEGASDIRSMKMISELDKDETSYVDSVEGLKDYWYGITSVDEEGNESQPSIIIVSRAFETT